MYQRIVKLIYSIVKIIFIQKDVQETRLLLQLKKNQEENAHLYAEWENLIAMERVIIDEELTNTVRCVDRANSRMMELETSLKSMATGDLHHIHRATGFDEFIVGVSWVSMLINKAIVFLLGMMRFLRLLR